MLSKRALSLKTRLANGEISSGMWISLPCSAACEIIADAGFDWIVVDTEHCAFNPETLQYILMAFKGDTVPIIRVPWNDHVVIKQVLDMGWDGVVIPQVNSADEASRAALACRYPPMGKRGFGPVRASNYYRDMQEYVEMANDSVICAIQLEDVAAADQMDEIVKIPGIDWILVGRSDISGTVGRLNDRDCEEVLEAVRKIFSAAVRAGMPCGDSIFGVEHVKRALNMGCQLMILCEDAQWLQKTMDSALAAFRDIVEKQLSAPEPAKV